MIPSVWSDCHRVCLSPHLSVIPSVFCQSIYLSVTLSVCQSPLCLSPHLSSHLSVCHSVCLSPHMSSVTLSICLSPCLSAIPSVCHPFACLSPVPVISSVSHPICLSVTQVASELPGLPLIRAHFWSSLIFEGPRFAQCLGIVCLETSAFWLPGGSWLSSPSYA